MTEWIKFNNNIIRISDINRIIVDDGTYFKVYPKIELSITTWVSRQQLFASEPKLIKYFLILTETFFNLESMEEREKELLNILNGTN